MTPEEAAVIEADIERLKARNAELEARLLRLERVAVIQEQSMGVKPRTHRDIEHGVAISMAQCHQRQLILHGTEHATFDAQDAEAQAMRERRMAKAAAIHKQESET